VVVTVRPLFAVMVDDFLPRIEVQFPLRELPCKILLSLPDAPIEKLDRIAEKKELS